MTELIKDISLEELVPVILKERCNFSALINIPLDLVYSEKKMAEWVRSEEEVASWDTRYIEGLPHQGDSRRMANDWNFRNADSDFICYAVRAGIGQYSINNGPAGLVSKPTFIFKNPSEAEMQEEFRRNPNKRKFAIPINEVTKEEIKEKSTWEEGHPTFEYEGVKYLYVAEPLLVKILSPSRFFSGDMPKDISSLVQDIDSITIESGRMHQFIYHFYHAAKGNLKYKGFESLSEYAPKKAEEIGKVRIHPKKRMFYYTKEKENGKTRGFSLSKHLDHRTSLLSKIKKERAEGDGTDDKYG